MPVAAILDIDGTLVDSNYQHAIAWYRAFREHEVTPPLWRVHRHIGMGGDQLVAAVAGADVEARCGDAVRETEARMFAELIDEVRPLEGARELIAELKARGHTVVLASSAKREEAEHFLDLLEARELVDAWTTSADVDRAKPAPDLVSAAISKVGGGPGVMVGDTTWDVVAASRAGLPTLCVLTGGFGEAELVAAGAAAVFESPATLCEALDSTPLR